MAEARRIEVIELPSFAASGHLSTEDAGNARATGVSGAGQAVMR